MDRRITYHRDSSTKGAYTDTTDHTTNSELLPYMSAGNLNDDTDNENQTFSAHSVSTTKFVSGTRKKESWLAAAGAFDKTRDETHVAPTRTPPRVPIESRETMRPERTCEKEHEETSPAVSQCAKRSKKSSMRRISEI